MQMDLINDNQYMYNINKPDGGHLRTNIILIGHIISQMKRGFSPIILIVGKQRIGKSFSAAWIAYRVLKFFHPTSILKASKYTFYEPLAAITNLNIFEKEPMIIDEAGAYLNKSEWYKKITIALDKIIQTQGYLCNLYIFVAPFGNDIAKTFRKHFDYVIFVRKRGILVVKQIKKKYDNLTDKPPETYRIEQIRLPYNALPKKIWADYDKHSKKMKEKLRTDEIRKQKSNFNKNEYDGMIEKFLEPAT